MTLDGMSLMKSQLTMCSLESSQAYEDSKLPSQTFMWLQIVQATWQHGVKGQPHCACLQPAVLKVSRAFIILAFCFSQSFHQKPARAQLITKRHCFSM